MKIANRVNLYTYTDTINIYYVHFFSEHNHRVYNPTKYSKRLQYADAKKKKKKKKKTYTKKDTLPFFFFFFFFELPPSF